MLTNAITRTSIEGNESEWSNCRFIEPSLRLECMRIFPVFRIAVNCDRNRLDKCSLRNEDILEVMILQCNTIEELSCRPVESLSFLNDSVKIREVQESFGRLISVRIEFGLQFSLNIRCLSEIPDSHSTKMSSCVHTSDVECHEFIDDLIQRHLTEEIVLFQIIAQILLSARFSTFFKLFFFINTALNNGSYECSELLDLLV